MNKNSVKSGPKIDNQSPTLTLSVESLRIIGSESGTVIEQDMESTSWLVGSCTVRC